MVCSLEAENCGAWQWHQGSFCGHGVETFADGAMYVGSYLDGLAEGLGICLYRNGSFYEGQVLPTCRRQLKSVKTMQA